ncbi:MAG: vitamin B12 dependent methionine synthase [Clostridiales bacterium]|nr:vitamin B12 dependent methionine synthase [Eubacteriales bacterium]MDH7565372.1 vitamin B12 dependent methionine synthase [Clostridiales bacterium]
MDEIILREIPVKLEMEQVKTHLKLKEDPKRQQRLMELIRQANSIAKPKAIYKMAFVDKIEGDDVFINGTKFHSRVMKSNLEGIGRVFAYSATCGTEIEEWSKGFDNLMEKYWANGIKEIVLFHAMEAMMKHLQDVFEVGKMASMNPGSLPDWPVTEQKPLISILGDLKETIGVTLTKGLMLVPVKSVTGILFPNETGYENCKLCTKKDCPGRRAPFDAQLYREKLG